MENDQQEEEVSNNRLFIIIHYVFITKIMSKNIVKDFFLTMPSNLVKNNETDQEFNDEQIAGRIYNFFDS